MWSRSRFKGYKVYFPYPSNYKLYFADFMHYALITYAKVRGGQATAWYTAFARAASA